MQLTTAAEASAAVERFLGLELTTRLNQAALEVLAGCGLSATATRPQIDQLRGVNSMALRSLLSKDWIDEVGRPKNRSRPILCGTTPDFLQLRIGRADGDAAVG